MIIVPCNVHEWCALYKIVYVLDVIRTIGYNHFMEPSRSSKFVRRFSEVEQVTDNLWYHFKVLKKAQLVVLLQSEHGSLQENTK